MIPSPQSNAQVSPEEHDSGEESASPKVVVFGLALVIYKIRDGRYGLIEAKLFSQESIDEGAKNLVTLRERIDTSRMKEPSFLMVVTGTPYAYTRDDGVIVAPLATLAP